MTDASSPLTIRTAGHRLWANLEFIAALEALGLDDPKGLDEALRSARRAPGGRGPQRLIDLPGSDRVLRLRGARRGGGLAALLPDLFCSPRRVEREFGLWLRLRERGAPLPTPVAAIARRRGLAWQNHLATLDCPRALDGLAWLASSPPDDELRRGVASVARGLRRFHDAGAVHGDLNLRNVLLEGGPAGLRCLFVDLDHARERRPVSPRARMRDLMRLLRSLEKRGFAARFDARLRALALSAYCAGDRRLRRSMLACAREEQRRLHRHRLAWRLQRALARGPITAAFALAALALACGAEGDAANETASARRAPAWSILAVGDTGRADERFSLFEGQLAVAGAMTREARRAPVDGVVLLGDNFYDHGLSRRELAYRIRINLVRPYCHFLALTGKRSGEVASACPLPPEARRPVALFAVLGNHDLELAESAELQRTAVPEFLPDWQMSPGLARVFEVHPGVSLILFESEIAIDERETIRRELVAAIRGSRGPWRILATHRPIATDDLGGVPHGGYPDYVRDALAEAGLPVQLVLCGHHHSLQAFALTRPTSLLQIGAGSGSRAEPPLATGHPALLRSIMALGFARVDLEGDSEGERLVVSLYTVPRWPWLERLAGHRLSARFSVDRSGRVDPPPAREVGKRPEA